MDEIEAIAEELFDCNSTRAWRETTSRKTFELYNGVFPSFKLFEA